MNSSTNTVIKFAKVFCLLLLAGSVVVSLSSCKPKKVEVAAPTPVPTPVPILGHLIFVQKGHLVELDLANSQITPLTGGKSTEWFPVSSPQGDQVIYWSNAENNVYNLWKLNLLTSQRTQLTDNDKDGLHPGEQNLLINSAASWSADEKTILYAQDGDIWALDADGYNPKTILSGHGALCPIFSPNGKTVLFISNKDDVVYNLYLLNQSDKTIKQITNYTDWNVGSPSFSTDGNKILYNLYRGDETQVYTAKVDGTEPLNLTTNNRSLCPRFGQGDKKIYYASYGLGGDSALNVYVMNANGTDIKALTTNGGSTPSWSPVYAGTTQSAAASSLPQKIISK